MKTKLKKGEILAIWNACRMLLSDGDKKNSYFSYALTKNKRILEGDAADIDKHRREILKDYFKEKNAFDQMKADKSADQTMKDIETKYAKELKEAQDFFDTEDEVEIYALQIENVPEMEGDFMEHLFPIIQNGNLSG